MNENVIFTSTHLQQLLEVAMKFDKVLSISSQAAVTKSLNEELEVVSVNEDEIANNKELVASFLSQLESTVGSSKYIGVYSEIQKKIEKNKALRKASMAAEAILDPTQYSQRKIEKSFQKRESRKRSALRQAHARGKVKKRNSIASNAITYASE